MERLIRRLFPKWRAEVQTHVVNSVESPRATSTPMLANSPQSLMPSTANWTDVRIDTSGDGKAINSNNHAYS
eukprot:CAMPEP_0194540246 /NCGR_PEP_ID=MMETSP0253-20130528/80423_1 /TAXON_ID=2966 /ORGANISM="Noctiluca scintillans" /LENGTH=71 /DNA_ID=CAMNT_0039386599 /DNA_START=34 /DNA_END=249 /DNA_ORIENTATION=-